MEINGFKIYSGVYTKNLRIWGRCAEKNNLIGKFVWKYITFLPSEIHRNIPDWVSLCHNELWNAQ